MSPRIRAAFLYSNLDALAALGPDVAARVRARLSPEALHEIEDAPRTAWLPVEHDVAITEAIELEVGRAAMRAWARDGVLRAADSPILSPMVRSARAIFGLTPHGTLRRVPQAWSLLYRDCGRMEYASTGERSAQVVLVELPAVLMRSAPSIAGLSAGLEAAMVLGGAQQGHVEAQIDVATRSARYACAW